MVYPDTGWRTAFNVHELDEARAWDDASQTQEHGMTPAKRKRLIKTYGPCPAGYTFEDLERFLDLLYGLYDDTVELRRMTVCNPFDRSETPQRMRLVDLADWLEALVS